MMCRRAPIAALVIPVVVAINFACTLPNDSEPQSVAAIRTEKLHAIEKSPLKGTSTLYGAWTLDNLVEITMVYSDPTKPCSIDVSQPAVLVKYEVVDKNGNRHFNWKLQPSVREAGCPLQSANFRSSDEARAHAE